ncbi:MAG: YciC family protein [Candidatus Bathyarchaeia archaeon]
MGCGLAAKCAFDILEGRRVNLKSNLLLTFKSLGEILGVSFFTGILIISGIAILIVPGVIIAVIFSLSIPALMYEQLGVFGSLKRSRELTDGAWWKTFLLLAATLALLIVAYLSAEIIAAVAIRQSAARIIAAIMVISFVEPIYPISISYFYHILRRRKSAYQPISREAAYPQRIQDMGVKVCYNCSQVLPYDAIYCPNCGLRVAY